eukprot:jgi/Tetstr1/429039/TSEL_019004.t1
MTTAFRPARKSPSGPSRGRAVETAAWRSPASMLSPAAFQATHDSGPARRGVAPATAWTVADALSVDGVAAGAVVWAPRIARRHNQVAPTARVRHHPADVVAFAEVAGDGVGWGAVDHLSDVDLVHMPAEMSMETVVPIDFQEAWAEAQRSVNKRVVAAVEADDPVVFNRALNWKYMLPQLLLRAPGRGGRRRQQALAWRFRAFAERRMTELMRSWDDARTEALYAGHARQRRTDVDLFAALLVGTADTVVALVEDGELSRAAGRLSYKGMGDLSDPESCTPAILAQLHDKHLSR